MKGEDLFVALGKIDDRFIESAAPKRVAFYQKSAFKWAMAVAACLCVLVTGYSVTSVLTARDGNLPKIDYSIHFDAMGYEGTDELSMKNSDDINPWNEDIVLETLPVYKNLCYNSGKLSQTYYSADDLKNKAQQFAEKMGLAVTGGEAVYGETEDEVYNYILYTEEGFISVNFHGICFNTTENNSSLFCHGDDTVSGDYYEYSSYRTRSYCKGDNITEDIINFNLRSYYYSEGDGYINSHSENFLNSSEKLGDYPVITLGQAKEKLLSGEYVTSADEANVQGGRLSEDVIAKTDLIYYTTGNQALYMPYYRFYVKYYSGDEIQQYAYFYVCAVEDKYLQGYEKFDGSFQ